MKHDKKYGCLFDDVVWNKVTKNIFYLHSLPSDRDSFLLSLSHSHLDSSSQRSLTYSFMYSSIHWLFSWMNRTLLLVHLWGGYDRFVRMYKNHTLTRTKLVHGEKRKEGKGRERMMMMMWWSRGTEVLSLTYSLSLSDCCWWLVFFELDCNHNFVTRLWIQHVVLIISLFQLSLQLSLSLSLFHPALFLFLHLHCIHDGESRPDEQKNPHLRSVPSPSFTFHSPLVALQSSLFSLSLYRWSILAI